MTAATFEIVIKGTLSEHVAALVEGFTIERVESGRTHLVGPVPDQSRLQGILTIFGTLNIELISLNPIASRSVPTPRPPAPPR